MSEPSTGRQAEEWLRAGERVLGIGFWSWNVKDAKFVASPGLSAIAGINPASVQLDMIFLESLVHPEDRLMTDEPHCLAVDQRQVDRLFRLIRPDGQLRWLQSCASSLFDREGALTKVVAAVADVTDAQNVRIGAGNMRALLNILSKLTGSAFWISTPGGQLVERFNANEELGLISKPGAPPSWRNVVHPEDVPLIPEAWAEAYKKRFYRFDARLLMADGHYKLLHAAGLEFDPKLSAEGHWGGISTPDERMLSKAQREDQELSLLTPGQVRACRALLDWNAEVLASKAGISVSTVRRLESNDVSPGQGDSMRLVMIALREAGLKIWRTDDGRFCVSDTR